MLKDTTSSRYNSLQPEMELQEQDVRTVLTASMATHVANYIAPMFTIAKSLPQLAGLGDKWQK